VVEFSLPVVARQPEVSPFSVFFSKTYLCAAQISTRLRYGLTGTVMSNNFSELYALMDFMVPGSLGPDEKSFQECVARQSPPSSPLTLAFLTCCSSFKKLQWSNDIQNTPSNSGRRKHFI
jgi:hypothetical protein